MGVAITSMLILILILMAAMRSSAQFADSPFSADGPSFSAWPPLADSPFSADGPSFSDWPPLADSPSLAPAADQAPPSTDPSRYPKNSSPSTSSGSKLPVIIGVSVIGVVVVVSLIVGIICIRKKKSKQDIENATESEPNAGNYPQEGAVKYSSAVPAQSRSNKGNFLTPESLQFEFKDLQYATNNFSKDNKIGRGGFGIVYKGILPNGKQIAVKRLVHGSSQGDKEFETEVVLLAKLKHRNMVRLLGFCLADEEALLVYEFVPNKSLDFFLFDSSKQADLNWPCRFEIIKGIARGLLYLHEDSPVNILHRDLKAANVLLDNEMQSKIADFGLARICDVGQTHINPTRVVGTHGYMAPEYLFHGQFSAKSDVFSLGVLILEIVSGRRVNGTSFTQPGGGGLLIFVWNSWEDEKPLEILDPSLRDSFSGNEFIKCVKLGLLCVQEDNKLRPTMSTIVHILNSDSNSAAVALPMPQPPAFIYSGNSPQTTTTDSTSKLY